MYRKDTNTHVPKPTGPAGGPANHHCHTPIYKYPILNRIFSNGIYSEHKCPTLGFKTFIFKSFKRNIFGGFVYET